MAVVNASLLLTITLVVALAALRRLQGHSPEVNGLPLLIASAATMLVMGICGFVVGGDDDDDLHMRSIVLTPPPTPSLLAPLR